VSGEETARNSYRLSVRSASCYARASLFLASAALTNAFWPRDSALSTRSVRIPLLSSRREEHNALLQQTMKTITLGTELTFMAAIRLTGVRQKTGNHCFVAC